MTLYGIMESCSCASCGTTLFICMVGWSYSCAYSYHKQQQS